MIRDLKSKEIIKCSDCDKQLVELILIDEPIEQIKLIVYCTCGGSSFSKKVNFDHKFIPMNNLRLKDASLKDGIKKVWVS